MFARLSKRAGFTVPEDAIEEALLLWEEHERKRAEFLATVHDAKAALARGEDRTITQESMRELATEVKQSVEFSEEVTKSAEKIFRGPSY